MPNKNQNKKNSLKQYFKKPLAIKRDYIESLLASPSAFFEMCDPPEPETKKIGSVAVIPVVQALAFRGGWWEQSTLEIINDVETLASDPSIETVILDIDSPGGEVAGIPELVAAIQNARKSVRVVASVNSMAASAAYWMASQADEVVITPSGEVGSIGIIHIHTDVSEAEEKMGIKHTIVKAGKNKWADSPFEPLSEEAEAKIQKDVDLFYGMFVKDVAKGRGVKASDVRNGFGQGGMVFAQEAKEIGMVDRIATIQEVLDKELSSAKRTGSKTKASVDVEKNKFLIKRLAKEVEILQIEN